MAERAPRWAFGVEENSMILTKRYGLIKIMWLTDKDLVWDGAEYVPHGGVLFLGKDDAVWYDGLIAGKGSRAYAEGRAAPVPLGVAKSKGIPLAHDGPTAGTEAADPGKAAMKRRLYTIIDCGPRHRFACNGKLVHNLTIRQGGGWTWADALTGASIGRARGASG